MTRALYSYQIAAGNNNAAGLVNIELIKPTGDKFFYTPESYGGFNPGEFLVRGDGTIYSAGFAATTWKFKVLTRAQYSYLQSTYCAGGFSGLVTIKTRVGAVGYANYNAVLLLKKPSDVQRNFTLWTDFEMSFARVVAL